MNQDDYLHRHAPPPSVLRARWAEEVPNGREIESFFLGELCESSEHKYFLAVSDILLDSISRQPEAEQTFSLNILVGRVLDAAEFARGISDGPLVQHFRRSIDGFVQLYYDAAALADSTSINSDLLKAYLVMRAVQANDLPLARLIFYREREIICTNTQCDNCENEILCPKCKEYLIPYVHYQRLHNCRNIPGHPSPDTNAGA